LFEKLPIYWSPGGRPPLRNIYRDLIRLRKQHPAFHNDEVVWLTNTVPDVVSSFMRRDDKDEFVVLINLSSGKVSGSAQVANAASFKPVAVNSMPEPTVSLPAFSLGHYEWQVYHRQLAE
jgi:glycosidase